MILQVAKLGPVSRAAGMDCEYPLDPNQASYGSENWQEENRRITREEDRSMKFHEMPYERVQLPDVTHAYEELIKELQELTAQSCYKLPLYSAEVLSVARTDRFTGYVSMPGQTVFNTETLQNLKKVE